MPHKNHTDITHTQERMLDKKLRMKTGKRLYDRKLKLAMHHSLLYINSTKMMEIQVFYTNIKGLGHIRSSKGKLFKFATVADKIMIN